MDMKTHIVRAVKYLIWLALLFTLVFALMISTGTSRVGAGEALHELFGSSRGMLMIATIVVLALLYPRFGFTRRSVRADLKADRERILQTLHTSGYSLGRRERGDNDFPSLVAVEAGPAAVGRPHRRDGRRRIDHAPTASARRSCGRSSA